MYPRLLDLCSLLLMIHCTNSEYYWRDYYGDIPKDAVAGGIDKNNHLTYIGQVFIHNQGLFPGQINAGKPTVDGYIGGALHSSDVCVKILCSQYPESFEWLTVTSKDLHTLTIGKKMVLGGSESNLPLNIGRIFFQSQVLVGKVPSYNLGHANLYFGYFGKEQSAESYQVLIYNANSTRHAVS